MERPYSFIMDFEGSYEVLLRQNNFDIHTFDHETTALSIFFEFSTEIHFVSLFFLMKEILQPYF